MKAGSFSEVYSNSCLAFGGRIANTAGRKDNNSGTARPGLIPPEDSIMGNLWRTNAYSERLGSGFLSFDGGLQRVFFFRPEHGMPSSIECKSPLICPWLPGLPLDLSGR